MEHHNTTKKATEVFFSGFLFIFCAIPGALITVFSSIMFILPFMEKSNALLNTVFCSVAFSIGSLMTLFGLRKFGKPLYLLVFLAIPLPFILTALTFTILPASLANSLNFPAFVFMIIIPFLTKKAVDKYYLQRGLL
jgi:hypothetical protein